MPIKKKVKKTVKKPKLKLFVWEDVLTDYTSGVMFALASSVEEARELISPGYSKRQTECRNAFGVLIPRPTEDCDLNAEPEIITTPKGFAVWGGG